MAVNKKSIIQILILVVLVVAGAGVYLSAQEGGLGFVTDLLSGLGLGEEKKTGSVPTPAGGAATKAPDAPAIPAEPAKGRVNGGPFEPESVVLESGVLGFVQSKEPQTAILIRLAAPKWETPTGKKFNYAPAGANAPMITVNRMESGEMKQQTFSEKYTLVLEFGKEKDRRLAGKIYFTPVGDAKTKLAGTFDAEIKGFRFVDGKPELASDSTDTLEYLALRELLKDDPDKPIDVIALRDGRFTADVADKNRTGYLEVEYRLGQGGSEIKRFRFVKDGEWKVQGTLALNEIDEAHPLAVPGAKDDPARILSYLAAKQLEAEIKKKSPKSGIYGVSFVTRQSIKNKIGVADVSYKLEPDGQATKVAYLFRLKQNAWVFDRRLTDKEKVNVDNGKIEKR